MTPRRHKTQRLRRSRHSSPPLNLPRSHPRSPLRSRAINLLRSRLSRLFPSLKNNLRHNPLPRRPCHLFRSRARNPQLRRLRNLFLKWA